MVCLLRKRVLKTGGLGATAPGSHFYSLFLTLSRSASNLITRAFFSLNLSSDSLVRLVLIALYSLNYVRNSDVACFNVPSIRATFCRCSFSTSKRSAFYLESSSSFSSRSSVLEVLYLRICKRNSVSACVNSPVIVATFC